MVEFLTDAGLFEEALHLLRKRVSLIVEEQRCGTCPSAEWCIRLGKGVGDIAFCLGCYSQSKRICEEALKIARKSLKPDDDLLLCLVQDLGAINLEMSQFVEARELCEEVVEIRRALFKNGGRTFNTQ
jgi:tetratricopeptide (TPR) repeat protein